MGLACRHTYWVVVALCTSLCLSGRDVDCPDDVSKNAKGDCVDDDDAIVDDSCCKMEEKCADDVRDAMRQAGQRMGLYMARCKVKQSHIVRDVEGSFSVNPDGQFALCSDACQGITDLAQPFYMGDDDLFNRFQDRCSEADQFEQFGNLNDILAALDETWDICRATTTVATTSTKTTTLTTTSVTSTTTTTTSITSTTLTTTSTTPTTTTTTGAPTTTSTVTVSVPTTTSTTITSTTSTTLTTTTATTSSTTTTTLTTTSVTTTHTSTSTTTEDPDPSLFLYSSEKHITYLIDRSKSMQETACSRGFKYSRYDFVVMSLVKALLKLSPDQHFNVIAFNKKPLAFNDETVPATDLNIKRVIKFLSLLPPEGGTDIEIGLKMAWRMPNMNVVNMLGDGVPTRGCFFDTLPCSVKWKSITEFPVPDSTIPINTVIFAPGEEGEQRDRFERNMQRLSAATNGKYQEPFPKRMKVCPLRVGMSLYIQGAGLDDVNGWWQQKGLKDHRPRYERVMVNNRLYMEWFSSSGGRWIIWQWSEALVDPEKEYLYYSKEQVKIAATKFWKNYYVNRAYAKDPPTSVKVKVRIPFNRTSNPQAEDAFMFV